MQVWAVWSALGGGAICATVAVVAVERMGGVEAAVAALEGSVNPVKAPRTLVSPRALATPEALTSQTAVDTPIAPAPAEPKPPASGAPAFDIVRVEPSGDAVVAGHASPHAAVELRDGGKTLAKIVADDSGQFAIVPDTLAAGDHALQLAARAPEGGPELLSDIAPVKVEPMVAAAVHPRPKPQTTPTPRAATPSAAPTANAASPPPASASTSVAALVPPTPAPMPASPAPTPSPTAAAVKPSPVAAVALAAPAPESPPPPPAMTAPAPAPEGLRITAATPNESGGFAANGGAQPGEKVVLRLNGSYIAEVVADALGRWSLTVERGLTAGFYALRAETFDASGKATGSTDATFAYAPRTTAAPEPASTPAIVAALEAKPEPLETKPAALETKPAEPAVAVAASPAEPVMTVAADPSHAVVAEIRTATVVKGDNLWDLARRFYGDGLRYADIFHANATQIHNPNLIYIGQVFVVPQARPTTP